MQNGTRLGSSHDDAVIEVRGLDKTYAGGFKALKGIDLVVHRGEIFALLGPNGAGKTTLISIICAIVNAGGARSRWTVTTWCGRGEVLLRGTANDPIGVCHICILAVWHRYPRARSMPARRRSTTTR